MTDDYTIQAIWLTVSDLKRSSAFYREVVGLRPARKLPGAAQFDLGHQVRLWLWPAQEPGAARSAGVSPAGAGGVAPATRWQRRGARSTSDSPAGAEWGARSAGVSPAGAGSWGAALVLAVPAGIEDRCRALETRGVTFEQPLTETPLGRMAEFRDPDGHLLCLWEPAPNTPALAKPPLSEAQARQSEEILSLFTRAEDAKARGLYAEAATFYRMIVEAEPAQSLAWGSLSYILNQQGRYQQSLEASERALALDPTLAEVWNNQGNALAALGRQQDALAAFERGIALAPATPEFLINKALALASLSHLEDALALLDRALLLNQDQAAAWNNRGWILGLLGRYEDALEAAERALALGLQVAGVWDTKGYALAGLGHHAEALDCYARALAETPHDPDILAHRAASLAALERGP